jgi:hypothetical protein
MKKSKSLDVGEAVPYTCEPNRYTPRIADLIIDFG